MLLLLGVMRTTSRWHDGWEEHGFDIDGSMAMAHESEEKKILSSLVPQLCACNKRMYS